MPIFQFTLKNFIFENGKSKQVIRYKFIEASNKSEAIKKLNIFPKLILKCKIYSTKNHEKNK